MRWIGIPAQRSGRIPCCNMIPLITTSGGAVIYTYQGQKYMAAGNKYGVFYSVKPPTAGSGPTLAWSQRVADPDNGKNGGGVFQPAMFTQGLVIVGAGYFPAEVPNCFGNLSALRPDTGELVWRKCTADSPIGPARPREISFLSVRQTVSWRTKRKRATRYGARSTWVRPGVARRFPMESSLCRRCLERWIVTACDGERIHSHLAPSGA